MKVIPFDSYDYSLSDVVNPVAKFEVFVELTHVYVEFSISPELGHGDQFITSFSEFSTSYSTFPWRHDVHTRLEVRNNYYGLFRVYFQK